MKSCATMPIVPTRKVTITSSGIGWVGNEKTTFDGCDSERQPYRPFNCRRGPKWLF
jgi:hypothetical protein